MNITVRRNCSSVVISVPGEWPTKEGPCLMRWLFFFPLLKKHFVCLIWWNFSLHLRDHEKLVPQQRQSFIVSHEPFVVRWGKFWRYRSHRSPLEITSSFLWILWILPLLQRSIWSIYLLGFFGGSFFCLFPQMPPVALDNRDWVAETGDGHCLPGDVMTGS